MHRYVALLCVYLVLADLALAFVTEVGLIAKEGIRNFAHRATSATSQQHCRRRSSSLHSKADGSSKDAYDRVKDMWDHGDAMDYIFENNKKWVEDTLKNDPSTFKRLSTAQNPKYLYIGCSDSRVPAQNMLGLTTGELFVHRNVANLCLPTDYSLLSVLAYAVEVLKVTDIMVCGHYDCGGVRAAMESSDHGLLDHWLHNIRDVQRLHMPELKKIEDQKERYRRLVELNVQEQCIHLFANPIVQKMQATEGQPRIHGWVYDVTSGLLKNMNFDFKHEVRKYKDIYRLYDFPRSTRESGGVNSMNMTSKRKVVDAVPVTQE